MTRKERKQLATTLATTLNQFTELQSRGAILTAKDSIADLIYNEQGLPQWSEFESQWRKEMESES